jgi:putative hemolysin
MRTPLVCIAVAGVLACTPTATAPDTPAAAPAAPSAAPSTEPAPAASTAAPTGAGLANPASVHCRDKGGHLEIVNEPAGEVGVCVFADGSRCGEWDFFRGRCSPGSCHDPKGKCSP